MARDGQTIDETTSVTLGSVAEHAWENVDTGNASLVVETNLQGSADPDRLQRLFENLFRNAIQHGRDDVTITVGTLGEVDGFYVADDGPGIPPDDRDRVLDDSYTTHEEGTGLGLSIVKSVVEAHGWSIAVTESSSGGAQFEIECNVTPEDSQIGTRTST
ncbi:sensor histidine kinase [Halorientalis salina]|uniref:sensor histidine kinase n=1 Tax=Halorientalis salina TaxID=2932266 RepID=UPI00145F4F2E|nr:HAMP domain-containing sensor histidine kinase [Halorientalis salina]